MFMPRTHLLTNVVAIMAAVTLPLRAVATQSPGAPKPGLRLAFQPAFTFARFTAETEETVRYSTRRGNSLTVRGSYFLIGALSGYAELGSSSRGSRVRVPGDGDAVDVRTNWWELAGGGNVALRCLGRVCPSLDVGGGVARSREALIRDASTGRPLATLPIARYESFASVGLRLVMPTLSGVAVVLRHQEGMTNLARDRDPFRSRAQIVQLALPLTRD
jgi:hypothetical protein